jgi:ribosomal protein S18 acetylase RimI-like enzyme
VSSADRAAELEEGRSERYFAGALREDTILVAEADGDLVAYVQFGDVCIPEVEVRPGDQALQRLYVDAPLQGAGLGRKLIEHPRLAGATRIYLTVWEKNRRAVRLYERFGFERGGTTTFTIGSEEVEDLVLALDRDERCMQRENNH